MKDSLDLVGRRLEDLFFMKRDAMLVEKQKELQRMERTLASLAEVSGIANREVLQKLMTLDVTPDMLATIVVVPVVEVAWADGRIDDTERQAVLAGAAGAGFARGSVDYALIEEWLGTRPPPKLMDAWRHYIAGLCESLTESERQELKASLIDHAKRVAEATGGFLGLTSGISRAEETILKEMESAFDPQKHKR